MALLQACPNVIRVLSYPLQRRSSNIPNRLYTSCDFVIPNLPLRSSKLRSVIYNYNNTQKYSYPCPIPDFAEAETRKFKFELLKQLTSEEDELFADELDAVMDVCTQVVGEFLHKEYGGPGTLIIEPFTYIFLKLKQKLLPGASTAARAALLWAQNHFDHDWQVWNST